MGNSNEIIVIPKQEWDSLNRRVEQILLLLEETRSVAVDSGQVIDRKAIAKRQGVSLSLLKRDPWRLPYYGTGEFATRKIQWRRSTYLEWEAKLEEHYQKWVSATSVERERLLGVTQ